MHIYLDTANIKEIEAAQSAMRNAGTLLDGITTNPTTASAYSKETGMKPKDVFLRIADMVNGPVSVETLGCSSYNPEDITTEMLMDEAFEIAEWHPRFVVKMPCTPEGVEATQLLSSDFPPVPVNMTLVFSEQDALCTAHAGARYCSPFVGRIEDRVPGEGFRTAESICRMYREMKFPTDVLFASARDPDYVRRAHKMGAHICTVPYKVFTSMDPAEVREMQENPLHYTPESTYSKRFEIYEPTKSGMAAELREAGLKRFLDDARGAGYRIIE